MIFSQGSSTSIPKNKPEKLVLDWRWVAVRLLATIVLGGTWMGFTATSYLFAELRPVWVILHVFFGVVMTIVAIAHWGDLPKYKKNR